VGWRKPDEEEDNVQYKVLSTIQKTGEQAEQHTRTVHITVIWWKMNVRDQLI